MSYIEQVRGLLVLAKEDLVIRFDGVSNNTFRKTIAALLVDLSILFSILVSIAMMLIITLVMVLAVMITMGSKSTFNFISRIFKGLNMKRHAPKPAMSPFEDGTPISQDKGYADSQAERAKKDAKPIVINAKVLDKLQKAGL